MRTRSDLVDPAFLARLDRLEISVRRLRVGERRGEVATRKRGTGSHFREHRPYVSGDDLRSIDWNAYLRLGELLVKEYDSEETPRLLLLIDRSASMSALGEAKFLAALRLAAALGVIGLSRHTTVACAFFPGDSPHRLFRGRSELPRFLDFLAGSETSGETRMLGVFQAACPPGRPAGVAAVISDFYETTEHQLALRFLRHRGFFTHALHVTDRADLEVEEGDHLDLVDAETGRHRRERVNREIAEAYRDTVRQHFRAVEETCRATNVLYARVDIEDPIERVIPSILKRGALAR